MNLSPKVARGVAGGLAIADAQKQDKQETEKFNNRLAARQAKNRIAEGGSSRVSPGYKPRQFSNTRRNESRVREYLADQEKTLPSRRTNRVGPPKINPRKAYEE